MSAEPTVFVVDDDPAVRRALHFAAKSAGLNVELYADAQEFLEAYTADRTGCLVLDVRMPGMSGLQLQEALAAHHVLLPVIILTGHGDVPMAVRALKQGAIDFLEKPFDNAVLLERIREAMAWHAQAQHRDAHFRTIAERLMSLKPSEKQILDGIVAGETNKRIAAALGLSIATVENQRRSIMAKLKAGSRSELVRMMLSFREQQVRPP